MVRKERKGLYGREVKRCSRRGKERRDGGELQGVK